MAILVGAYPNMVKETSRFVGTYIDVGEGIAVPGYRTVVEACAGLSSSARIWAYVHKDDNNWGLYRCTYDDYGGTDQRLTIDDTELLVGSLSFDDEVTLSLVISEDALAKLPPATRPVTKNFGSTSVTITDDDHGSIIEIYGSNPVTVDVDPLTEGFHCTLLLSGSAVVSVNFLSTDYINGFSQSALGDYVFEFLPPSDLASTSSFPPIEIRKTDSNSYWIFGDFSLLDNSGGAPT